MKRLFYTTLYAAAALCMAGCAKIVTPGPNEANKREFEAWMYVNYPECESSGLGIYVIDKKDGIGKEVTDDGLVLVDYKVTDLEGNISSYTDSQTAKQLGKYNRTSYYGPKFWTTYKTTIPAGLGDAVTRMKVGGQMDVIIPSWLMTAREFDSAQGYLDYYDEENSSSFSDTRYRFTVVDFTEDVDQWQIDSIGRFFRNPDVQIDGKPADVVFNGMDAAKDTVTTKGFYYRQLSSPAA